ncbi:hypothetical protein AB833_01085 [Chromatiales bacterium (ex Bugula neritina AB1)]|nr:hypothetical protein AB833_01085 [Chromatiales bacterium (ex Bugula neritina AB1)]
MKILIIPFAVLLLSAQSFAADDEDTSDINAELKSIRHLIYKEQYARAINDLISIVFTNSDNADAWNLLGYASRKDGKLQKSAEAYEKALAIDPNHKGALAYQGELFLALGQRARAEDNLDKLGGLCPEGCGELEDLADALADR